jgi:N-glycosylase/DNA lyase
VTKAVETIGNCLRQAARNELVAIDCLTRGTAWEWRQWGATSAFYAGVHLAKALAIRNGDAKAKGEHWHDFYSRMIRTYTPSASSVSYERLRKHALMTRYDLYMPPSRTARKLVHTDLRRVDKATWRLC